MVIFFSVYKIINNKHLNIYNVYFLNEIKRFDTWMIFCTSLTYWKIIFCFCLCYIIYIYILNNFHINVSIYYSLQVTKDKSLPAIYQTKQLQLFVMFSLKIWLFFEFVYELIYTQYRFCSHNKIYICTLYFLGYIIRNIN